MSNPERPNPIGLDKVAYIQIAQIFSGKELSHNQAGFIDARAMRLINKKQKSV